MAEPGKLPVHGSRQGRQVSEAGEAPNRPCVPRRARDPRRSGIGTQHQQDDGGVCRSHVPIPPLHHRAEDEAAAQTPRPSPRAPAAAGRSPASSLPAAPRP